MIKFEKDRSVNPSYYRVPLKYCLNVKGEPNKEFVIIDINGKNAICAWRNTDTCKIGITFTCRLTRRNNKLGFIYKDKFVNLNNSGWVW